MKLVQRVNAALPYEGRLLLLAAVVMMVPAWVKGINLLLLLACLLLALCAVNWLAAGRQVRRLRAGRRWEGPVFAGVVTHWEVEVSNASPLPSSGFRLTDVGAEHRQEWFVSRVEARSELRLRAAATLARRGRYALEPVRATCLYPFGLARSTRPLTAPEECLVLPRLGRLDLLRFQHWLHKIFRGDGRLHRLVRPSMIQQDDLHGLRPFRPGDNPRWIHWRTSARRNQKMVREFEEDTGQNLILVFEPFGTAGTRPDPALEAAVSLAATIAWEWCHQSADYLMLAVAGSHPAVTGGFASRDNALTMLRDLAVVRPEPFIDPVPLLKAMAAKVIPEAPVLLVSPRAGGPLHERLAAAWDRPLAGLTPEVAAEFYDRPPAPRP